MYDLDLITTLAGGLAAALLLGYATQRLGLSPIVGYLLAGLGIILLMFRSRPPVSLVRAPGSAAHRSPRLLAPQRSTTCINPPFWKLQPRVVFWLSWVLV